MHKEPNERLNALPAAPRVRPSARFARNFGAEIRQAAQSRIRNAARPQLGNVVIELRKLVKLLQRTLVPVHPSAAFAHELEDKLYVQAVELYANRQQRRRWLMVGGIVGSILSLLGLVAALFVRRRNGHSHAKRSVGLS